MNEIKINHEKAIAALQNTVIAETNEHHRSRTEHTKEISIFKDQIALDDAKNSKLLKENQLYISTMKIN